MALSDMIREGAEFLGDFAQGSLEMLGDFAPILAVWTVAGIAVQYLEDLGSSPAQGGGPPIEPQRQAVAALERRKQELAEQAAEPGSVVIDELRQTTVAYLDEIKTMRHELFCHRGEVEEIENALRRSEEAQKQGSGYGQLALLEMQGARRLAQTVYQTLCELELEWEEAAQAIRELTAQMEDFMERCAAYPAGVKTSEGREEIELDVDYWTDGGLSALREPSPAVERDLPLEELHALIDRERERFAAMLALPQTALDALCAAQIRREICSIMHDTLVSGGWTLTEPGYREEKHRAQLQMKNAAQDVLLLTVSHGGECRLRALFHEVGNTEVQQRLAAQLQDALRENGFSVEDSRVGDISEEEAE